MSGILKPADQQASEHLSELISLSSMGNSASFAELYQLTYRFVHASVLKVCKQSGITEDIVQEIYISLWNRKGTFEVGQGRPLGWLKMVAQNRAIDSLRRSKPERLLVVERDRFEDDPYEGIECGQLGVIESVLRAAEAAEVARCLASLSPVQRQCIALSYYSGMSHHEVAEHLSYPLGTVKSHMRRALALLRSTISDR